MKILLQSTVLSSVLVSASAIAQSSTSYPSRPIRFVVGFAAGGPTDVIARITGQDMGAALGQTVVVENRAGANAQIATENAQIASSTVSNFCSLPFKAYVSTHRHFTVPSPRSRGEG